jgi:hypothetical protein
MSSRVINVEIATDMSPEPQSSLVFKKKKREGNYVPRKGTKIKNKNNSKFSARGGVWAALPPAKQGSESDQAALLS